MKPTVQVPLEKALQQDQYPWINLGGSEWPGWCLGNVWRNWCRWAFPDRSGGKDLGIGSVTGTGGEVVERTYSVVCHEKSLVLGLMLCILGGCSHKKEKADLPVIALDCNQLSSIHDWGVLDRLEIVRLDSEGGSFRGYRQDCQI